MEGAARPWARLGGAAVGAGGGGAGTSLLLLENMAAGLDEVAGISGHVVVPDFIMDMRSGAASGGADASQIGAFSHPASHPHTDGGEMAVAGVDAIAVIDLHHIAIAAAIAGKDHGAGC